jgi:NAD(P)-dependent dehydrogenase (short-subunit alcohol dehydrogenase family)
VQYGIEGRVAVISGAAGGIGAALAQAFARQRTRLVLIDRDAGRLDALVADNTLLPAPDAEPPLCIVADLTDDASVGSAADRIRAQRGRVDILINNAGTEVPTPIADAAPDFMARWEDLLRNNAGSMVRLTRALLPLMSDGGAVINQSSIWGHTGVAGFSAYVASKHAVLGVTRSLAWELTPARIRVNAVCPGWVRTAAALHSLDALARAAARPADEVLEEILAAQAVPQMLEPADVAGAFLFLASDDARAITGQSLVVSHGEVMQ